MCLQGTRICMLECILVQVLLEAGMPVDMLAVVVAEYMFVEVVLFVGGVLRSCCRTYFPQLSEYHNCYRTASFGSRHTGFLRFIKDRVI